MSDDILSSARASGNVSKSNHPLYSTWIGMRHRCNDPKRDSYPYYGGRGIKVCGRWNDFWAFVADVGERPSPKHQLDRIDGNGHYEPSNVRWADRVEQGRNTRRNRMFTVDGETRCLKEWSQISGVACMVILGRITRGWSIEDAIKTPSKMPPTPLTDADRVVILEMRASGVTVGDIARQYGKDPGDMSRFIAGKKKPRAPRKRPKIAEVIGKPTGSLSISTLPPLTK